MPGNETQYKSSRENMPVVWKKSNVPAGQATGLPMEIAGLARNSLPLTRESSLVSLGITLTEVITAGLIRFEITKNGTPTGKTFDMDSTKGVKQVWEFDPGKLVGAKGDEVGLLWGSSGALTPSGTIEAAVFLEVQPV